MFPTHELNPYVAARPGEPGLLFSVRLEMIGEARTAFSRRKIDNHDVWEYLGEYVNEVVGKLTPHEFDAQSAKVCTYIKASSAPIRCQFSQFRERWGSSVAEKKSDPKYLEMRARIGLRKDGKAITNAAVAEEVQNIKITRGRNVCADDVIQALRTGEEVRDPLTQAAIATQE